MHILVTGGAGYIGSHTVLELLKLGYKVSVIDNLSNSSPESLKRVEKLAEKTVNLYNFDLCDTKKTENLFVKNKFDAVIHFAGLKAVGESVQKPLLYYRNNIGSTLSLLQAMQNNNVKQLIFSSSATVYGDPATVPIKESAKKSATNPYGQTKLMIENILEDVVATNDDWRITSLRYFNPIGAHESGHIGEDPNGVPNNLLPYISQVAVGKLPHLSVYGNDYPTPDGTGVRDYIHVTDLAKAHVAALKNPSKANVYSVYNIGTGNGTSVLQMVDAFTQISNKTISIKIVARRQGDIAECFADPSLANAELAWQAEKTIQQACQDAWRWQSQNPHGYQNINL